MSSLSKKIGRLIAGVALLAASAAPGAVDPGAATAPRMEFSPPPAGSYRLQRIQGINDAVLIDHAARRLHLKNLTQGKVTLLTFFYIECPDPLGCPFAYGTLYRLRSQFKADPAREHLRFVSVSLDPTHDTPQALAQYAGDLATDANFEWRFLTAGSMRELLPVLDDFGQDVGIELDAQGRPTRTLHHMLKMFLIDINGEVREIYSLAFLQPPVIVNDIRTLLAER